MMEPETRFVKVDLPNGQSMQVEASVLVEPALEGSSFEPHKFDRVIGAIEGIALAVQAALVKAKPTKATVELGLEVGMESGQLTALLVKGSGKSDLKITLTWE